MSHYCSRVEGRVPSSEKACPWNCTEADDAEEPSEGHA